MNYRKDSNKLITIILAVTGVFAIVLLCTAVVKGVKSRPSKPDTSVVVTPTENASEKVTGNGTETDSSTEELTTESDIPEYSDAYIMANAKAVVSEYAQKKGISLDKYPEYTYEMLENYPQMLEFLLRYPEEYGKEHKVNMDEFNDLSSVPLFLQWDERWGYLDYGKKVAGVAACGPTCLSMVAYYLTGGSLQMTPDKIIQFSIDNGYSNQGTPWTFFSEGSKKLGLNPKELSLDENRMAQELEAGHPIICNVKPGIFTHFGHYIVLSEYKGGKFTVRDPNSIEHSNTKYSFDEIKGDIRNLWSFSK